MKRFAGQSSLEEQIAGDGYGKWLGRAQLRVQLALAQVPLDIIAIALGYWAPSQLVLRPNQPPLGFASMVAIVLLYAVCAVVVRAYSPEVLMSRGKAIVRVLAALAMSNTLFTFLVFLLKVQVNVSRIGFLVGGALSAILLVFSRYIYVKYTLRSLRGSLYTTITLLDEDGVTDPQMQPTANGSTTINIKGLFDPVCAGPDDYDALARLIRRTDRVVVKCSLERRLHWAHALQGMNVHAEVVAPEIKEIGALALAHHDGQTTLVLARGPLALRSRLCKRAFDIAFSLAALVILSPMLLATTIAIKLDSPGPVFFRQPRIGRQNRVFYIFKFRSMYVDLLDSAGHVSTRRGDSRITRVGQFIRASSIDELPQLLNVLIGDMSVVGPRPHAVYSTAEERLFWEIDRRYWHRHACKPGITGLAQIKGLRGATEVTSDVTNRVSADLEYMSNWSFLGDLMIIFRTFSVIFHHKAY